MTYTKTDLPGSQVQFTLTIPASDIQAEVKHATATMVADAEMPGFRKGHVPESIVVARVGTMAIWEEALRQLLPNLYVQIVTESKVPAIGRPSIAITAIADQGEATATITTQVIPEFTLPDLKKIAKEIFTEKSAPKVTDKDVTEALMQLRKLRQSRDMNHEGDVTVEDLEKIDEADLPELTDEFASSFGQGVTSVADLSAKIKKNLEHEAIHQFEDRKRGELVEKLMDATTMDVPELLVIHETDKILAQYEHDMTASGVTMKDYLEHIKKTIEEVRADLREGATKRAKTQLILEKIAEKESVKADPTIVEGELAKLKVQYKEVPHFDEESARSYLEQVLTNQAVFAMLEKLGGYESHDHDAMNA